MKTKSGDQHESFGGEYEVVIEQDGSFMLPDAFCEKLSVEADGENHFHFLLHDVLCLYGVKTLRAFLTKAMDSHDSSLARRLHYQAYKGEGSWSPTGKTVIPSWLLESVGLSLPCKVILVGMENRIEVWPEALWAEEVKKLSAVLEPLSDSILDDWLYGNHKP